MCWSSPLSLHYNSQAVKIYATQEDDIKPLQEKSEPNCITLPHKGEGGAFGYSMWTDLWLPLLLVSRMFCTFVFVRKSLKSRGTLSCFSQKWQEHTCSCTQIYRYSKWLSQTLQGMHRSTSHKLYHDVRRQLCTQSRLFSALPCGHVGRQRPQCIKELLEQLERKFIFPFFFNVRHLD